MLIKIFGNGSGLSLKRKSTSFGIYGNVNILVEVPKDISYLYSIDRNFAENLDYVIITHAHHDHYGDIEELIMIKEFIEKKKIKLIIPNDVELPIHFLDRYKPKLAEIIRVEEYKDENIEVTFFPVEHPGLPTYGVKIKESKECIGYSSDTKNPVVEKLAKCNVIFHDCGGGQYHTDENQVYKEGKRLNVLNKLYAIHVGDNFKPRYLKLAEGTIEI